MDLGDHYNAAQYGERIGSACECFSDEELARLFGGCKMVQFDSPLRVVMKGFAAELPQEPGKRALSLDEKVAKLVLDAEAAAAARRTVQPVRADDVPPALKHLRGKVMIFSLPAVNALLAANWLPRDTLAELESLLRGMGLTTSLEHAVTAEAARQETERLAA